MKAQLQLLVVAILVASQLVDEAASHASCNCKGTTSGGVNATQYICRDSRLGPKVLPKKLPLGSFVSNYDRFGGLTPGQFLEKWTDASGNYVYPEQNGYELNTDDAPILGDMTIATGTLVDRFGSEYGKYLAAADAPYSQRSLPPSNLDTNPSSPEYPYNYHLYRVLKPLTVQGGMIAPWFGQPGLGTQFYTGAVGIVLAMIAQGYLARVDTTVLTAGDTEGCG